MKETLLGGKEGWLAGAPVVIGYFPVAMAFGLLAKAVHVPLLEACLFSLIVFAGASQFMALELLRAGVATGGIVAATLLLNLRHLMMSASLAVRLIGIGCRGSLSESPTRVSQWPRSSRGP